MVKKEKDDCPICAAKKIKILDFPNGVKTGIIGLEDILKEVVELRLTDPAAIKAELLQRVKNDNYVVRRAEAEYKEVLFKEYLRRAKKAHDGKVVILKE
jgi:hypothetical protein